jgi:hypothetical protein
MRATTMPLLASLLVTALQARAWRGVCDKPETRTASFTAILMGLETAEDTRRSSTRFARHQFHQWYQPPNVGRLGTAHLLCRSQA